MAAAHRCRHVALEQLPLPRLHDGEPDSPDPAAQQVHAQQSGDQEVDIPRPRRDHPVVAHADEIPPPPRPLQHVVHRETREPALGAGRVVAVHHGVARDDEERDSPSPQPQACGCRIEDRGDETGGRRERGRDCAVAGSAGNAHLQFSRAGVPKGEPEREGEHDREAEHPEYRFRLAVELPHPRERQLVHRMLTYHGAAVP